MFFSFYEVTKCFLYVKCKNLLLLNIHTFIINIKNLYRYPVSITSIKIPKCESDGHDILITNIWYTYNHISQQTGLHIS